MIKILLPIIIKIIKIQIFNPFTRAIYNKSDPHSLKQYNNSNYSSSNNNFQVSIVYVKPAKSKVKIIF
jgi:hypothetical protein